MKKVDVKSIDTLEREATQVSFAGVAASYLRSVAQSLESFAEFDAFLQALERLVGQDLYLIGSAQLCDVFAGQLEQPDFDVLKPNETVIAVAGKEGSSGFLKYSGRGDGRSWGAEDLHLMGAISGLIASLIAQAQQYREKEQSAAILQYLINQLPLGVVCFDGRGRILVENEMAQRLLGEQGVTYLEAQLSQLQKSEDGRVRLHVEVEGKLIYLEGRLLEVAEGVVVETYVLYDMSASRQKLMKDLELEAYMSESRGGSLVLVVMESRESAGGIYSVIQGSTADLELQPAQVQPLDAYTCACLFRGRTVSGVRSLLKHCLPQSALKEVSLSIVEYDAEAGIEAPADALLVAATSSLDQAATALLPELLVQTSYPPLTQALELILADLCHVRMPTSLHEVEKRIRSGRVDGLILDLDGCDVGAAASLRAVASTVPGGVQFIYVSYMQAQMARVAYGLAKGDTLLQKPFDTVEVLRTVRERLNLA